MSFYKPFPAIINSKPILIYAENGLERVLFRERKDSIEKHLEAIYHKNHKHLHSGEFHIAFVWSDDEDIMSDIWIFENLAVWKANPTVDAQNFRGLDFEEGYGVTAGDELMILGKEEEFRRTTPGLEQYLDIERPAIPKLISEDNFYL